MNQGSLESDRNRSEQSALVLEHQELAMKLASKMLRQWKTKINNEELSGIASLALCEAAARYSPEKGAQFSTFLYHYLRGLLLDTINAMAGQSKAIQVAALHSSPDKGVFEFEPDSDLTNEIDPDAMVKFASSPEDILLRLEAISSLAEAVNRLPKDEQECVATILTNGGSIGGRKVSDQQKTILQKLKEMLDPNQMPPTNAKSISPRSRRKRIKTQVLGKKELSS
mgnify:CR=1 FL=1